ncbi:MAG TPA: J domain-containing protein [Gaiellaceae bacterium]|jgi:hypothetical protein
MNRVERTNGVLDARLATLCLPPTATAQDARRAFRALMLQLHPDASGGTRSPEHMTAVVDAYRDLTASGFLDEHASPGSRRNGQLVDIRA